MRTAREGSSIFKTRGPLDPVSDAGICAPRAELKQLLRMIQAPTVDAYLAILSSRQTGKTTLLYQLRSQLRPRGYGVAFIDLAVIRDQSEGDLYPYLASQIASELDSNTGRSLSRRQSGPLPTNPVQFRQFLLDLARQTRAPRLVILIDEIESIPDQYADAFFGTIRNIFSSRRKEDEAAFGKYLFVLCGAKELHRLTSSPNSPLNIVERIYLQDLTLDGVASIVSNFSRDGISAPRSAAQLIYEQTRGHPYLTQKLCAQIEQWHPGNITEDTITRAAVQLLKGDDHLEKMIQQIDGETGAKQLLKQIVSGKSVQFSRLQPAIARLELLGAIRDAGQCAIRNPIYYAAFRTHFDMAPVSQIVQGGRGIGRWIFFVIAMLFFLLNIPFVYNYLVDIYFSTRSVNDRFVSKTLNNSFTIHYDRVLLANSSDKSFITIDFEGFPVGGPVSVTFQPDQPDITLEGTAQRKIDQPFQQVNFTFMLNQNGLRVLRYNPFKPWTEHRGVTLIFESPTDKTRRETYRADFVVDYYSAFIFSAALSVASFVGALGAIFGNMGHLRRVAGLLGRSAEPT